MCVGQREDVGVGLGDVKEYYKGKDYKEMMKEMEGPEVMSRAHDRHCCFLYQG